MPRLRSNQVIGHAGRAAGGGALGWIAVDPASPLSLRLAGAGGLTLVIVVQAVCNAAGKYAEPASSLMKLLWSLRRPKPKPPADAGKDPK